MGWDGGGDARPEDGEREAAGEKPIYPRARLERLSLGNMVTRSNWKNPGCGRDVGRRLSSKVPIREPQNLEAVLER